MSLYAAIGTVDNLNEAPPFFNHRANSFGFVIAFLVRFSSYLAEPDEHLPDANTHSRQLRRSVPRCDYMSAFSLHDVRGGTTILLSSYWH